MKLLNTKEPGIPMHLMRIERDLHFIERDLDNLIRLGYDEDVFQNYIEHKKRDGVIAEAEILCFWRVAHTAQVIRIDLTLVRDPGTHYLIQRRKRRCRVETI